jgi:hypothetical protein
MALTARHASQTKGGYIEFQDDWFDYKNDATPDGSEVKAEMQNLGGLA